MPLNNSRNRSTRFILMTVLAIACSVQAAWAQQKAGDKEFGFGGSLFAGHKSPFSGSAFAQASIGKFFSTTSYFGVSAGPQVTFGEFTSYSMFTSVNYRQFITSQNPKFFPFVGVGGGGSFFKAAGTKLPDGTKVNGSSDIDPNVFGEFGIKSYISQRTSFEVAYNFLVNPNRNGGFGAKSQSIVMFSIRHLF
jgi:hypothetical protein